MEGAFRASSLRFLNDTEEFRHGVKVAMEVLQQEMAKARVQSGYDHFGTVYEEVLEFFNDKFEPTNVFVASLSTERDDLSQWRAYGGAGPHFSIGFLPDILERTANQLSFALDEVRYKRTDIEAELRLAFHGHIHEIGERLQVSDARDPENT